MPEFAAHNVSCSVKTADPTCVPSVKLSGRREHEGMSCHHIFIKVLMQPNSALTDLVTAQHRGEALGLASLCSADPFVIEAAFRHALPGQAPVLIESTCNQVNQFGGYTGMTPAAFVTFVEQVAEAVGFPRERIILGGDHLGPSPWQKEASGAAMAKSRALVRACVEAGYAKLHLDASMKCADDDPVRAAGQNTFRPSAPPTWPQRRKPRTHNWPNLRPRRST